MLTMLGASHHDAPLEARERLAIPAGTLPQLLESLRERFGAGAVLATCNRLELYLPGTYARDDVLDFLAGEAALDRDLAARCFRRRCDAEAVRHLYSVAAGIDSMVLGESEILGQVRDAFSAAVAAGSDDTVLSRLFHTAIRVGRRARSETAIGHHSLSISSIAAQQARALHPDVERAVVLVLGAGEAGRIAAQALVERGVGEVLVANRTAERARELAGELGGRALPFEALGDSLETCDVVIAASGAPGRLLERAQVASAAERRDGRPLVIIDIGVPRDVDPAVREIEGVTYRDLDDLQEIAAGHFRARAAEVGRVREIVEEEAQRFVAWWEQLRVVPTISALTEHIERLRRAEVERSLPRLGLSGAQSRRLEALTKALAKQILHRPIATLRERGDRDVYVDALRTLFDLDERGTP